MKFENSYARLPDEFHAVVEPDAVEAPSMLAWNHELAVELGLDSLDVGSYGVSETTGEPIGYDRLTLIPWARTGADDRE
jgi:uncharacterized protein YdiU (UPF0061 family)